MLAVAVARRIGGTVALVEGAPVHTAGTVAGLRFDESGATGNVFVQSMPSTPDTAVAVMAGAGLPQPTKGAHDLPTLQILVRGADPVASHDLAQAIYSDLNCLDGVELATGTAHEVFVHGCTAAQSAPIPLGLDPNQRHEWSLNFDLSILSPTTHRPAP